MSRHRKLRSRRPVAVAVLVLGGVVVSSGTALAFWTGTGTGTGRATAGTAQPLVVTPADLSGLYPGGSRTGDVVVKNTNPYSVVLTAASATGTVTVDAAHAARCAASSVTFTTGAVPTATIAPGATATLPYTAAMSSGAASECQGADFTSSVTVDGRSS